MTPTVLYAYVDGYDLDDVVDLVVPQLQDLVASQASTCVWVVNQRSAEPQASGDLPPWDLGVNVSLMDVATAHPVIDALLSRLPGVAVTAAREFVVGLAFDNGITEDLLYLPSRTPDQAQRFRAILDHYFRG